jgi:hypothetical protein
MLASSRALVYAIMGLEAEVLNGHARRAPDAFQAFGHDVEFTLYFVSAALRGSHAAAATLPSLREDYSRLLDATPDMDELMLMETDRVTSAVNTLREQVMRYTALPAEAHAFSPATAST